MNDNQTPRPAAGSAEALSAFDETVMDVVDAFVRDDTFEYMMDAICSECSDEQWQIILHSIDWARQELAQAGANATEAGGGKRVVSESNHYKLIWDALTPEMQKELIEINDPAEPVRDVAEILLKRNMAFMDDDSLYEIKLTKYGKQVLNAGQLTPSASPAPETVAEGAGNALIGSKNLPTHWIKMYRDQVAEGWNEKGQSNNVLDLADLAEALALELKAARDRERGLLAALDEARRTFVTIQAYPDTESEMDDWHQIQGMVLQAVFGAELVAKAASALAAESGKGES